MPMQFSSGVPVFNSGVPTFDPACCCAYSQCCLGGQVGPQTGWITSVSITIALSLTGTGLCPPCTSPCTCNATTKTYIASTVFPPGEIDGCSFGFSSGCFGFGVGLQVANGVGANPQFLQWQLTTNQGTGFGATNLGQYQSDPAGFPCKRSEVTQPRALTFTGVNGHQAGCPWGAGTPSGIQTITVTPL